MFRRDVNDPASALVHPYLHQSEAIRKILSGRNVIVATGPVQGKASLLGSLSFRRLCVARAEGVRGIQAVIVYPMNALANSQYDEFSRRLHGSGLRLALYTGDTASSPAEAIQRYREATKRNDPYDCEVLSRQEFRQIPPIS